MFEPIGGMRKLKFPLYNQETNGNVTDDAGLTLNEFIWPEDPEERTILPLFVSQREFTAILSAMDVGADIAYPEQYIEVMWLMVRNLRYGVNICQMIADCIATSPETQQALRDFVTTDQQIIDTFTELVEGLTEGQIISPVVEKGCDPSDVAGAVIAIVERMDTYNVDALEIIEVGTNDEEKIASVVAGIPALGILPFDEIIDFAQDLLEDFFENYNAAVTEEWKDDVAEDLYCLALEDPDCKLSYEQLFNYFQNRAGSSLTTLSTIVDIINFVRTGDFNTDELVASGMYAIQLAFVRVGREFFGINLPKIGALTRDALPSSRWEEWDDCGGPPPDPNCVDLTEDEFGWSVEGGNGSYVSGQGFAGLYYGVFDQTFIHITHGSTSEFYEKVIVRLNEGVTELRLSDASGGTGYDYTGAASDEIEFSIDTFPAWVNMDGAYGMDVRTAQSGNRSTLRIVEICKYPAP